MIVVAVVMIAVVMIAVVMIAVVVVKEIAVLVSVVVSNVDSVVISVVLAADAEISPTATTGLGDVQTGDQDPRSHDCDNQSFVQKCHCSVPWMLSC